MKHCLSDLSNIDAALRGAQRILIASDFDGTLCPIAPSPDGVYLPDSTLEILQSITESSRLTLAVLSGRALADIRRRVPLDVIFAGNHGLEIHGKGWNFEHPAARIFRPTLSAACATLAKAMVDWPEAWVEHKGLSATLHFRMVEERHHGSLLFAARRCLGRYGPQLSLRVGQRALEVRARIPWDKGSALQYIQEQAGPFDACVCLGDERTDEMMFRANRGNLNVRVGCYNAMSATHHAANSGEAAMLLSHLVDTCNAELELGASHCASL